MQTVPGRLNGILPPEYLCGNAAGEIMPDGEHRSRYGCHGEHGEMGGGKGCGESGILHSDFDGDGGTLALVAACQRGEGITEYQSENIMKNDHHSHYQTAGKDIGGIVRHDDSYD